MSCRPIGLPSIFSTREPRLCEVFEGSAGSGPPPPSGRWVPGARLLIQNDVPSHHLLLASATAEEQLQWTATEESSSQRTELPVRPAAHWVHWLQWDSIIPEEQQPRQQFKGRSQRLKQADLPFTANGIKWERSEWI
ncbi:unnamed protein product [Arctogadus glacialis]